MKRRVSTHLTVLSGSVIVVVIIIMVVVIVEVMVAIIAAFTVSE